MVEKLSGRSPQVEIQGPHQRQTVRTTGAPLHRAKAAMLLIHGRGARAEDILSLAESLTRPEFAFLAPQAAGNSWYPNRFLAPVESNEPWLSSAIAFLDETLRQIAMAGIPPEQTILLGFSQGACLGLEYAARRARRYGGLIGLSGGLIGPDGTPRDYAGSLAGTPVFLGCSDVDIHIPKERVLLSGEVFRNMHAQVYVSYAQEVIFAPGSLARLDNVIEQYGWKRLLLCTNHSMRLQGHTARVEAALGERLAAVFDHVQPHVPDDQVEDVFQLALKKEVDAIIGMGGGSPIGLAKAVGAALQDYRADKTTRSAAPVDTPLTPIIAIPCTYAGSEMTATYGITRTKEEPPHKITFTDSKVAPKLVLYDPELTLELPQEMTASTGINALAHCLEALYSITRYPISSAAAVSGIQHIHNSLLTCYQHPGDLEARSEMLQGAHLAGFSLANASMGLHHGLCHVLGGTARIPHGMINSILLPHTIRFNADATAALLLPAALALCVSSSGDGPFAAVQSIVQEISHLINQMSLPQRLRDVGVKETDLPQLAQLGFQNRTVQKNPKLITDVSQLERLLSEAW